MQYGLQAAGTPSPCANLAAALAKAVAACKPVPHDARNEHHRYAYTSSEAIIEEARNALAANGLSLVPLSQHVNGHEREGADRFELAQTRLLLHVSGESLVCTSAWPITPGAGRPLDKATAAADTLSLSYFLRDLLQMPRVDPQDEVAARDDSKAKAPKQQPARPSAPADGGARAQTRAVPSEPKTPEEFRARLESLEYALIEKGLCEPGGPDGELKRFASDQKFPADIVSYIEAQLKAAYAHLRGWKQRLEGGQAKAAKAAK